MKLKNKKTGEIVDTLCQENAMGIAFGIDHHDGNPTMVYYNSLAELNEEWEDYEEPKDFWYIEPNGVIARIDEWDCCTTSDIEIMKSLGNYFETKEEAELAVRKLKAWKRLKDKGFKFGNWYGGSRDISFYISQEKLDKETAKDLDLLFGGEE